MTACPPVSTVRTPLRRALTHSEGLGGSGTDTSGLLQNPLD